MEAVCRRCGGCFVAECSGVGAACSGVGAAWGRRGGFVEAVLRLNTLLQRRGGGVGALWRRR